MTKYGAGEVLSGLTNLGIFHEAIKKLVSTSKLEEQPAWRGINVSKQAIVGNFPSLLDTKLFLRKVLALPIFINKKQRENIFHMYLEDLNI